MIDLNTIMTDIKDMRALQVEYFKTRNPVVLKECKSLEQYIDRQVVNYFDEINGQTNLLDQIEAKPANEKGFTDD